MKKKCEISKFFQKTFIDLLIKARYDFNMKLYRKN